MESFGNFLNSFGFFWNLLDSFGISWILLESFGIFWNLMESSGILWNLLDSFGFFCLCSCLCRLSLQTVSAVQSFESFGILFRAAWSAWDSSSSELLNSSLGILGA